MTNLMWFRIPLPAVSIAGDSPGKMKFTKNRLADSGFIKTMLLAGRFLRRGQSSPIAIQSSESSATTKNPDRN